MAASTSREPQDVPLLPNPPSATEKPGKSSKKGKGKEKGKDTSSVPKKRSTTTTAKSFTTISNTLPIYEDDPPLNWVPLTDFLPTKTPPIFTKDGRWESAHAFHLLH